MAGTNNQQQQLQALSAFSLLVDVANARNRGSGGGIGGGNPGEAGTALTRNGRSSGGAGALNAAAATEERMLAIRDAAAVAHQQQQQQQQRHNFQQQLHHQQKQQQQQHHQPELEAIEMQEALQRELIHREAMRRQQTAIAGFGTSGGAGPGGGGGGVGGSSLGAAAANFLHNNSSNSNRNNNNNSSSSSINNGRNNHHGMVGAAQANEVQYLQQLRLEAIIQQRRQETLAQLALAQELGMSQENMASVLEAEQIRHTALIRQEMILNGALEQGLAGGPDGLAAIMAAGGGDTDSLLSALGASVANAGGGGDEGILQLLQERERQRQFAALFQAHQAQQQQQQAQAVGSAASAFNRHGHGMERADLIGSVFGKNTAAIAAIAKEEQLLKQKEKEVQPSQMEQQHHQQQQELEEQIKVKRDRRTLQKQRQVPPSPASLPQLEPPPPAAVQQQISQLFHEDGVESSIRERKQGSDDSKTTVLPCRARGMPMDHNVKTAFFVTPEDIKHGTELVCSYFPCRNAGIKFRYCVYCKLPVAKRNFAKRHRHWGKIAPGDLPKDILEGTCADDDLSTSDHGTITTERTDGDKNNKLAGEIGGDDDASDGSTIPERSTTTTTTITTTIPALATSPHKWNSDELLDELMSRNVDEIQRDREPPQESFVSDDDVAKFVERQKEVWEGLLLRRPRSNSSTAMLAWVQDVLRISDMGEILRPSPTPQLVQCKVVPPPAMAAISAESDLSLNEIAKRRNGKNDSEVIIDKSKALKDVTESKPLKDVAESKSVKDITESKPLKVVAESKSVKDITESKSVKDIAESKSVKDIAEPQRVKAIAESKSVKDITESKSPKETNVGKQDDTKTKTSSSKTPSSVTAVAIYDDDDKIMKVKTVNKNDVVSDSISKDGGDPSGVTTTSKKEMPEVNVFKNQIIDDPMKDENDLGNEDDGDEAKEEEDDDDDDDEEEEGKEDGEEDEDDDDDHEDGEIADDVSTSSEDSVDLRVSKKART